MPARSIAAPKTRARWAAEICAVHKQTVEGYLKLGHTLIAAKKALPHGQFQAMISSDLPFDASTAQRLMKIARDPRLRKAAPGQLLPASWRVLYEITKLDDASFEQAIVSGTIHRNMTRTDARMIHRPDRPMVTVSPRVLKSVEDSATTYVPKLGAANVVEHLPVRAYPVSPRVIPPTLDPLEQIGRLVDALSGRIERGEITIDTDRARIIAEQLLAVATAARQL